MSKTNLIPLRIAKEMRQRASMRDLMDGTRELLRTWAETLEREYTRDQAEAEEMAKAYEAMMAEMRQMRPLVEALAHNEPTYDEDGALTCVYCSIHLSHTHEMDCPHELARILVEREGLAQ